MGAKDRAYRALGRVDVACGLTFSRPFLGVNVAELRDGYAVALCVRSHVLYPVIGSFFGTPILGVIKVIRQSFRQDQFRPRCVCDLLRLLDCFCSARDVNYCVIVGPYDFVRCKFRNFHALINSVTVRDYNLVRGGLRLNLCELHARAFVCRTGLLPIRPLKNKERNYHGNRFTKHFCRRVSYAHLNVNVHRNLYSQLRAVKLSVRFSQDPVVVHPIYCLVVRQPSE